MDNTQDVKTLIDEFKKNSQKSLEEIDKTFNVFYNNIKDTFNMYNDLLDTLARNLDDATDFIKTKSNFVSILDETINRVENTTTLFSQEELNTSDSDKEKSNKTLDFDELMERKLRKRGKVY